MIFIGDSAKDLEIKFSNMDSRVVDRERIAASISGGSIKQRVRRYQAYLISILASIYNDKDTNAFEIGTYYGYTAAVISQAMPKGSLVTINVLPWEVDKAKKNLAHFKNIHVFFANSRDRLKDYSAPELDFLFIDGDHKRISQDLPWFNHLRVGGLLLCHDYSPEEAAVACPPVYNGLNEMKEKLGRDFDVLVVDSDKIGMAGFYRGKDEVYE